MKNGEKVAGNRFQWPYKVKTIKGEDVAVFFQLPCKLVFCVKRNRILYIFRCRVRTNRNNGWSWGVLIYTICASIVMTQQPFELV